MGDDVSTVHLGQFDRETANDIAGGLEKAGIVWWFKAPGYLSQIWEFGVRLFVDRERLDEAQALVEQVRARRATRTHVNRGGSMLGRAVAEVERPTRAPAAVLALGPAVVAFGFVCFEPHKLFFDDRVDEALPSRARSRRATPRRLDQAGIAARAARRCSPGGVPPAGARRLEGRPSS